MKLFDDFYLLSSVVLSLSLWHTKTPHFLNSIPYCLTNGVQFIFGMQGLFLCLALYGKLELVGARPLHLAAARPFGRLKSPLGTLLFRFAAQTRTCRGKAPPSCYARPFCRLKAPLGLSLFHFAPQTRTCRGEAPPSCCRKTVLSLKSPTGAFIVPLRYATANLSGRGPSILLPQDRSVA